MPSRKRKRTRIKVKKIRSGGRSYTLTEIIVVVTIIALLATLAFVIYSLLLKRARDARRKSDVEKVKGVLEIYKQGNENGSYPSTLDDLISGGFLTTQPLDPKTGGTYTYKPAPSSCDDTDSSNPCTSYTIEVNLESPDNTVYIADLYGGTYVTSTPALPGGGGGVGGGGQPPQGATATPTSSSQGQYCWGVNGVCDAGCNKSSLSSKLVYTGCTSGSCTCGKWVDSNGLAVDTSGWWTGLCYMEFFSNANCQNLIGYTSACGCCSSNGSGYCFGTNANLGMTDFSSYRYALNPHSSYKYSACSPKDITLTQNMGSVLYEYTWNSNYQCSQKNGTNQATKYDLTGNCNSDGSGNCYKPGSSNTYYTGSNSCHLGNPCGWFPGPDYDTCPSGTYYNSYNQCSYFKAP